MLDRCFVISLIFALFTPILPGPLAMLLAGNGDLAALAEPYMMVNFVGIPILTIAIIFCYFMNADNHPQLGSALFIVANVVNLVLDVVFLKVFHLGMAGSALSTIIGYLVGMVTVVFYFCSKHRMLHFRKPGQNVLQNTFAAAKAGIPSAAFILMSALKSIIINSVVVRVLGNDSMAVYSVCANAVLIAELCVGGVISLIQNIAGILYGEQDYFGIRMLCKRVLIYSYAAIAALLLIFPDKAVHGIPKHKRNKGNAWEIVIRKSTSRHQHPWKILHQIGKDQKQGNAVLLCHTAVDHINKSKHSCPPNQWISKSTNSLLQLTSYGVTIVEHRADHRRPFIPGRGIYMPLCQRGMIIKHGLLV